MTAEERKALDAYVAAVRARFGAELHDILVFGSRARGDNRADSDLDLAVICRNSGWDYWSRKFELLDMGWDAFANADLDISPWPVSKDEWDDPGSHHNPKFICTVRREARAVSEAA